MTTFDLVSGSGEVDVAVIGAGAAGIAAGRVLAEAAVNFVVLEARSRIGGRSWTRPVEGFRQDFGCGWLHSGDVNPWTKIAEATGFTVDRTPAPWSTEEPDPTFPRAEFREFRKAAAQFYRRVDEAAKESQDRPAADFLEPGGRWNELLNAISTYANGAELAFVSVQDMSSYADDEVNWRVTEGYGAMIAAYGANLPVALDCTAKVIDLSGKSIRIETSRGQVNAKAVIITLPSNLIADESLRFTPALPDKVEAAASVPLGLADKVLLAVDRAEDVPAETRVFGSTTRTAMGAYHLRPFGRPLIEGYFGGECARQLEREGEMAFAAFAIDELAAQLGGSIREKLRLLGASAWANDPFSRGSYSHALPGKAGSRAVLAQPVDDRLYFAGEACSTGSFSTAHGAYETGVATAKAVLGALAARR